MTRLSKIIILFCIIATMVLSASAGSLSGGAGSSAGITGNGMAVATDWNAQYEAGYDLVGTADQPGASFSLSATDNSQDGAPGPHPALAQVKATELKVSGKVTGPSDGSGFAQAIASVRALVNRDFEELGATQTELTAETWIFASTHTYAGSEGVTATASATASGTATASAATPELGSIMSESKGKATATSSATFVDGESSGSVSAAMIGAASHIGVDSAMAGYPSYLYTPISLFHPLPAFDPIVYPYFYPGNGLATANLLEGTGSAKSSASGSATASGDSYYVERLPTIKTTSSGTVASGVSGTDTEAGAISGINAWAFVEEPDVTGLQEGYLPTAVLDAGSTIFATGGVSDEPLQGGVVSSTPIKKPVTADTATFSASGKSSGLVDIGPDNGEIKTAQLPVFANLEATSSGSMSGSATQDGGGAIGSINVIAARALGYPEAMFDWGILLPSTFELNTIGWELGAGEGALYSLVGSGSGSIAGDGIGTTSASVTGSADASGSAIPYLIAYPIGYEGPTYYPGISGEASAKGSISSKTSAVNDGISATTSQIMALGGEGPLFGEATIDFYGPDETIGLSAEVGGMTYLTTMDYAASSGIPVWTGTSTTSKNSRTTCPITSATSTVKGQADFEGSSVMSAAGIGTDSGIAQFGFSVEDHQASSSSSGTVTGSTSAIMGEADTGSLLFSASAAELNAGDDESGATQLEGAVTDYSLILSDSSAVSSSGTNTAFAKGTADGSTTANSYLDYWTYMEMADPEPVDIYFWDQIAESTTKAKGKITTEATACGESEANAIAELKSYNEVLPAVVEVLEPTNPPIVDITSPAVINDDSVLVSGAQVSGSDSSSDKASAKTTLDGSTCSEGEDVFTFQELVQQLPVAVTSGNSKPPEPVWEDLYGFEVEGATTVSNADSATAKGSGSNGAFFGWANNYACADQMTSFDDNTKTALAQGIFGVAAHNEYPGTDVTVEAKLNNVKVFAYADPPVIPMGMAKVDFKGGKASTKLTGTTAIAPPATYSSLTLCVVPPVPLGGTDATGVNWANAGAGQSGAYQAAIADSTNPTPIAGSPPVFPDILNPAGFWS